MIELSDVYIALPGGPGTIEEITGSNLLGEDRATCQSVRVNES